MVDKEEIKNIFNQLNLLSNDKLDLVESSYKMKGETRTYLESMTKVIEEHQSKLEKSLISCPWLTHEDEKELLGLILSLCQHLIALEKLSPSSSSAESGFLEILRKCFGDSSKSYENLDCFFREDKGVNRFSPVFIYDDADLDSAVESSLRGAWRFKGKLHWSVTHVYIQESVYEEAVSKLKKRCQCLLFGEVGEKFCHFFKTPSEDAIQPPGDFEVFVPCPESQHRLFVGWDPKDFGIKSDKNMELCIIVKPFKTALEPLTIIKKASKVSGISIWTSKESLGEKILNVIEAGTVWLNCHGVLHTSTSFKFPKGTSYPLLSPSLCYLMMTNGFEGLHHRIDIPNLPQLDDVVKAQTLWSALGPYQRLEKCRQILKCKLHNWFEECLHKALLSFFDPSIVTGNPLGVVMMAHNNPTVNKIPPNLFLFILSAMAFGNGVVIVCMDESSVGLLVSFSEWLANKGLPKGLFKVVLMEHSSLEFNGLVRRYSNSGQESLVTTLRFTDDVPEFLDTHGLRKLLFTNEKSVTRSD